MNSRKRNEEYLGRKIVDVGASHSDEAAEAFDLGGDIGGVQANLHHFSVRVRLITAVLCFERLL